MKRKSSPKQDEETDALRRTLVDGLKKNGVITDSTIEATFRAVPRHVFLPDTPLDQAYKDAAVITKQINQKPVSSASQPSVVATMLAQLDLRPGQRVLEIGAGTGYNAALMAHIVGGNGLVTTIDIDDDLVGQARTNLKRAGCQNVRVVCSDGGFGYADSAPYDRIILTVGASDIAPAWRDQLKQGGLLLIPFSLLATGISKSIAFEKTEDCLVSRSIKDCAFLMLRGEYSMTESAALPIGPEPGIQLNVAKTNASAVDPGVVYTLLTEGGRDISTDIRVRPSELATRFYVWMSLQRKMIIDGINCSITAVGAATENGIVPYLFGIAGKVVNTCGAIGEENMALLMRHPDSGIRTQPAADDEFQIFVRSFGRNDRLARSLIDLIADWVAAGKPPDPDRMKVRVYANDFEYTAKANELVSERPHARLVVEYC